jgi:hypothetical protein
VKQHPTSKEKSSARRHWMFDVRYWLLDVFLLSLFAISAHAQSAATLNIQADQPGVTVRGVKFERVLTSSPRSALMGGAGGRLVKGIIPVG